MIEAIMTWENALNYFQSEALLEHRSVIRLDKDSPIGGLK